MEETVLGKVSRNCGDCFYRGMLTSGNIPYCGFILKTGKRRPCPAGDGCTVKVPRKVCRRRKRAGV